MSLKILSFQAFFWADVAIHRYFPSLRIVIYNFWESYTFLIIFEAVLIINVLKYNILNII